MQKRAVKTIRQQSIIKKELKNNEVMSKNFVNKPRFAGSVMELLGACPAFDDTVFFTCCRSQSSEQFS